MARTARRVAAVVLAASALVTTGLARPVTAAPATIPTTWVHHAETPWSWWSPPSWVDAHGVYDLNLSSATGALWAKQGFSMALVLVPGGTASQNAAAWFDYWAQHLRGTADMYGRGLSSMRYTSVGAITELPPTIYGYSDDFRQRRTYVGTAVDGTRVKGELVMDYVESLYGDIGIESFKARATPRSVYDTKIRMLRKIHKYVTYTGELT